MPGSSGRSSGRRDLSRKALGNYGEELVGRWYLARGFSISARQWRCEFGELDLVLSRDATLVFCEVKTRKNLEFGGAEIVGKTKQLRIRKSALMFLQTLDDFVPELRFDVAVVCNSNVEVIENAF